MRKNLIPLLVVSALSLGIGASITSCDSTVTIPSDQGPDFTESMPVSVTSIEKTSSNGLVDTYTITYSNGKTSTFTVTNGKDGADGSDGKDGQDGQDGAEGPKGDKGDQGIQGIPGEDGHTPVVTISEDGYWVVDGVKTEVKAAGEKGEQGEQGEKGEDGTSFLNGASDPTSEVGKDGDTYLNYVTLDLFVRTNGVWELVNNLHGTGGAEFLRGEGIPSDELGKDGDTYLDQRTSLLYGKEDGHWRVLGDVDLKEHEHVYGDAQIRDNEEEGTVEIYKVCEECGESTVFNSMTKKVYAEVAIDESTQTTWITNDDGWYQSTNHDNNSNEYLYFDVLTDGIFKYDYNVSSESQRYDYLRVGIAGVSNSQSYGGYVTNDSSDIGISGSGEIQVTAGQQIYLLYAKDSSGTKGRDEAKVKITTGEAIYNVVNFANIDEKVVGETEPMFIENGTIKGELPQVTYENNEKYFRGWYVDEALTEEFDIEGTYNEDIVVYAKWLDPVKVTLDYNYNGIERVSAIEPGTAMEVPTLERDGYYFLGWHTDVELETKYNDEALNGDTTLYAKWIKVEDAHELYGTWKGYQLHGGSINANYATMEIGPGGEYKLRTAWSAYKTGTIGEDVDGVYTPLAGSDDNSNIYVDGDVMIVSENSTFAKDGYTFVLYKDFEGFPSSSSVSITNYNVGGSGPNYSNAMSFISGTVKGVTRNVLIDFRDSGNPSWTFDVTKTGTNAVTFTKGETEIAKLYSTFYGSSSGYTEAPTDNLAGTYTQVDGEAVINLTGTGYITYSGLKYLDVSGGEQTGSLDSLSSSSTYEVDEINPNVIYFRNSSMIRKVATLNTEDHTFTVVDWTHTVTFDYNYKENEGDLENKTFEYNALHDAVKWLDGIEDGGVKLDRVVRDGYIFDGWYDNPEFTGSSISRLSATNAMTLYAKWVVPVSVSAHLNDEEETVTVYNEKPETRLNIANPTRVGYKFAGWYTTSTFDEDTSWNGYTTTENIDIYAKWVEAWNYSDYVGSYKGGNVYGNKKNEDVYTSYQLQVASNGSTTGKYSTSFAEAMENNPGQIELSSGYKLTAVKMSDGRTILVSHYRSPNSDFVSNDMAFMVKVNDGETLTSLKQTTLVTGVYAVEITIGENIYNVVVDSVTDQVYTDVTYIINGAEGSFSGLHNGTSYADKIVIKKGETILYSYTGGSSLTSVL